MASMYAAWRIAYKAQMSVYTQSYNNMACYMAYCE